MESIINKQKLLRLPTYALLVILLVFTAAKETKANEDLIFKDEGSNWSLELSISPNDLPLKSNVIKDLSFEVLYTEEDGSLAFLEDVT
jgi:hypothetical protein